MTKGSNFGVISWPTCEAGEGLALRKPGKCPQRLTMSLDHFHNTSHVPGSWGTGRQEAHSGERPRLPRDSRLASLTLWLRNSGACRWQGGHDPRCGPSGRSVSPVRPAKWKGDAELSETHRQT